jgi:hypothetical protein
MYWYRLQINWDLKKKGRSCRQLNSACGACRSWLATRVQLWVLRSALVLPALPSHQSAGTRHSGCGMPSSLVAAMRPFILQQTVCRPHHTATISYVGQRSQDNLVLWLGCGLSDWFLAGERDFSLAHNIQSDYGTHPASCVPGPNCHFPRVTQRKWNMCHVNLVLKSKLWSCYFNSPCVIKAWCLIKHKGNIFSAVYVAWLF